LSGHSDCSISLLDENARVEDDLAALGDQKRLFIAVRLPCAASLSLVPKVWPLVLSQGRVDEKVKTRVGPTLRSTDTE